MHVCMCVCVYPSFVKKKKKSAKLSKKPNCNQCTKNVIQILLWSHHHVRIIETPQLEAN